MAAAEQRIWGVIMSIADGHDVVEALRWLVTYCGPEMDLLQVNAAGVEKFFANGMSVEDDYTPEVAALGNGEILGITGGPEGMDLQEISAGDGHGTSNKGSPYPPAPVEGIAEETDSTEQKPTASAEADMQMAPSPEPEFFQPEGTPTSARSAGSPLPDLTETEDDDVEDQPLLDLTVHAAVPALKSSGRFIKVPKFFTSGTTLTQGPTKKRKREAEPSPEAMPPSTPTDHETLFWDSTFAWYSAAVRFLRRR